MSLWPPQDRPGQPAGPDDDWRVEFSAAPPSLQSRLTRPALVVLVFLGAMWAFSTHFADVAEKFDSQAAIVDETGRLTPADLERLRLEARLLREGYGVGLRLRVRRGPANVPPLDAATVFLGLDATTGRTAVVLPPLVVKALPADAVAALTGPFLDPYFAANAWPEGLSAWVALLVEHLDDASK